MTGCYVLPPFLTKGIEPYCQPGLLITDEGEKKILLGLKGL